MKAQQSNMRHACLKHNRKINNSILITAKYTVPCAKFVRGKQHSVSLLCCESLLPVDIVWNINSIFYGFGKLTTKYLPNDIMCVLSAWFITKQCFFFTSQWCVWLVCCRAMVCQKTLKARVHQQALPGPNTISNGIGCIVYNYKNVFAAQRGGKNGNCFEKSRTAYDQRSHNSRNVDSKTRSCSRMPGWAGVSSAIGQSDCS